MQSFLQNLLQTIISQLIPLFGGFFLFGIVLSVINHAVHNVYRRSIGWKGILWTAWFGTPIHELGHALFAKLFGHKIIHISFFAPNPQTGGLGHVEHSYHRLNIFQRVGNFFIGIAPLLFGSLVLFLFLRYLVPNGQEIFASIKNFWLFSPEVFFKDTWLALTQLFSRANMHSWQFWVFLYISFCVAAHMAPSKEDRKNMWDGVAMIILLLFIINIIALLLGKDVSSYITVMSRWTSVFFSFFLYATLLSLIHLLIVTIFLRPFSTR